MGLPSLCLSMAGAVQCHVGYVLGGCGLSYYNNKIVILRGEPLASFRRLTKKKPLNLVNVNFFTFLRLHLFYFCLKTSLNIIVFNKLHVGLTYLLNNLNHN